MKTLFYLLLLFAVVQAGGLESISFSETNGLEIASCVVDGQTTTLQTPLPLFSVEIDDSLFFSSQFAATIGDSIVGTADGLAMVVHTDPAFEPGYRLTLRFINSRDKAVKIANVVPFGQGPNRAYITGSGSFDHTNYLSRTVLFTPDLSPVGVVVPDNAWEAGFCTLPIAADRSLTAVARRTSSERAERRRYWTSLESGGSVEYTFYIDTHSSTDWRDGLRQVYHDRWLYDMPDFDRSLYDRKDLHWIRDAYFMLLQMAWDKDYYDRFHYNTTWYSFLSRYDPLWGKADVYLIWPTWPRLGLDPRNQWDLYEDLPGGLDELRRQVRYAQSRGTRYFISYNPWDTDTRDEDHLSGMERLLRLTDSDGVVLDTRGESSKELQETADRVKRGVIMYSEGMPVPKHMPTIVTGRVHDAIYLPPPVNLNKYIFPENQIYRVLQLTEGRLHREVNVCLFNGYGMELNVMRAGRPSWMQEEFRYMGRVLKVLRDNSKLFSQPDYQPLIPVQADSLWVNRWDSPEKTLYTVYSLIPQGFDAPLIEVEPDDDFHTVSLWHHQEIAPVRIDGVCKIPVTTHAFDRAWLGTRQESQVDCIARFPRLISFTVEHDSLSVEATRGDRLVLWAGDPAYDCQNSELGIEAQTLSLRERFGNYEGKFVLQLFSADELIDERVFEVALATPRLITSVKRSPATKKAPRDMVKIKGGPYLYKVQEPAEANIVLRYPDFQDPRQLEINSFFMDKYPVTNRQYHAFIKASGYSPRDTVNFLAHWSDGQPPEHLLDHPVVNVSLEDARAYAQWAGKRLPTDIEWQYAAQGTDGRRYPWGNEMDSTRCNSKTGATTPVDAFPSGASPFGVLDMVGNVWQLVDDTYDNGTYLFALMRGGSYYYPDASIWYITGGPWPVDQHKLLLLVSPGFDRSSTVGFRCVKDAK
ncbi:SUMF1/EgtB/PvdO family nonheme iron enzyme [candidate division KSB1 bacterium]|nr:SUMF1/EgtB/PvdO family nonheme iron enzyme [candidate division KSB1 bacterium]